MPGLLCYGVRCLETCRSPTHTLVSAGAADHLHGVLGDALTARGIASNYALALPCLACGVGCEALSRVAILSTLLTPVANGAVPRLRVQRLVNLLAACRRAPPQRLSRFIRELTLNGSGEGNSI